MKQITTIAIDLAKHVFEVVAEDARGEEQWHRRLRSRAALESYIATLQAPLIVGLEAGLGAQAWARRLQAQGVTVRVLPAQHVADHRSGAKNDLNDARAILRALRDRTIHPVPVKTVEQLTMQAVHRVRSGWMSRRIAVSNQLRGLLLEQGIAVAQGDAALEHALRQILSGAHSPLPERLHTLLSEVAGEWHSLKQRLEAINAQLQVMAREDATACRLRTVPGIGPVIATALVCKGLDPTRFRNARQLAAYLGLVPEQHSSGAKIRLGRMSRRGDGYLRSALIEGAHAVLRQSRADSTDVLSQRLQHWKQRHGAKGAAVRLANHNVRVVWSLLHAQTVYRAPTAKEALAIP